MADFIPVDFISADDLMERWGINHWMLNYIVLSEFRRYADKKEDEQEKDFLLPYSYVKATGTLHGPIRVPNMFIECDFFGTMYVFIKDAVEAIEDLNPSLIDKSKKHKLSCQDKQATAADGDLQQRLEDTQRQLDETRKQLQTAIQERDEARAMVKQNEAKNPTSQQDKWEKGRTAKYTKRIERFKEIGGPMIKVAVNCAEKQAKTLTRSNLNKMFEKQNIKLRRYELDYFRHNMPASYIDFKGGETSNK